MSQAQRKPKTKRALGDLAILILIGWGGNNYQALADKMSLSTTPIHQRVERLKLQGLIAWGSGHHTLHLTEAGQQATAGYLLSRCGERVTGVWKVDWVLTTCYSSPLGERESVVCTVEEYEEMAS